MPVDFANIPTLYRCSNCNRLSLTQQFMVNITEWITIGSREGAAFMPNTKPVAICVECLQDASFIPSLSVLKEDSVDEAGTASLPKPA